MPASNPTNNPRLSTAPIGALRQFTRKPEPARAPVEHCELCAAPLAQEHHHLLAIANRTIVCACGACTLLFSEQGAGNGKYRAIPRRSLILTNFQMTNEQWEDLALPVNMVYIFRSTPAEHVVAFYPSPAGATESLLSLESWEALVANNPILQDLQPDVEALLINRIGNAHEYYIAPIDVCYQLVGLIRVSWRGLSGGDAVWKAIAEFFANLRTRSRPLEGVKGETDAGSEL